MYVRLHELQPKLEDWIKKSWKAGKWSPNSVINGEGDLVDTRLKSGLRPSPLTRDLQWGVPVPADGAEEDGMTGKVLCTSLVIRGDVPCSLVLDVWVCSALKKLVTCAQSLRSLTRR
jgi:hypothetical protein